MDETVDTRDEEEQGDASPVGEIVDWVARGIIEGRLQPGDDLNSVDLAKRFNVSRTPVREALFVLNRER
ncbi:GntR family transcriptional regulator, partial [Paraburkholderia dipogonis]